MKEILFSLIILSLISCGRNKIPEGFTQVYFGTPSQHDSGNKAGNVCPGAPILNNGGMIYGFRTDNPGLKGSGKIDNEFNTISCSSNTCTGAPNPVKVT